MIAKGDNYFPWQIEWIFALHSSPVAHSAQNKFPLCVFALSLSNGRAAQFTQI